MYENQIKELKSKSFWPITSLLLDLFFEILVQLDEKVKEIESIQGKLNNKEAYFNKKLLRLTQCEYTIDKLTKELLADKVTLSASN